MPEKTVTIPGVMCGHCVNAVKNEALDIAGVTKAEGDPQSKQFTFVWDAPATWEQIAAALKDANYPPAE